MAKKKKQKLDIDKEIKTVEQQYHAVKNGIAQLQAKGYRLLGEKDALERIKKIIN
jgi:predicted chitinase